MRVRGEFEKKSDYIFLRIDWNKLYKIINIGLNNFNNLT